jgi:hypothetical protein
MNHILVHQTLQIFLQMAARRCAALTCMEDSSVSNKINPEVFKLSQ